MIKTRVVFLFVIIDTLFLGVISDIVRVARYSRDSRDLHRLSWLEADSRVWRAFISALKRVYGLKTWFVLGF